MDSSSVGSLDLSARYPASASDAPVVRFPDGCELAGDEPAIHDALSTHVGRTVTLAHESDVSHFDECPVHLVTTRSLARLAGFHGAAVDPRHFRANLVVDDGQEARSGRRRRDTGYGSAHRPRTPGVSPAGRPGLLP